MEFRGLLINDSNSVYINFEILKRRIKKDVSNYIDVGELKCENKDFKCFIEEFGKNFKKEKEYLMEKL